MSSKPSRSSGEIIADNLSKAGWSWGRVSAIGATYEGSGLQMHTAATESGSLRVQMKT